MKLLITGGAGFIGSAMVRYVLRYTGHHVVNLDKLTYAANRQALADIRNHPHYAFERHDICDPATVAAVFARHQPDAVLHLAAESHVDRSIADAANFVQTNIAGTYTLLEAARNYWQGLTGARKAQFRFHHVSTDEVYGDWHGSDGLASETSAYAPSSPYAASKAAADHLVRAWQRTYALPILVSHCTNNYGPWQCPEKLIPLVILNALHGKPLPIYGQGLAVRDWLYVEDHVRALYRVLCDSPVGETWHIAAYNAQSTLDVVHITCALLEELAPDNPHARCATNPQGFAGLIRFVPDRPGHDLRYALDAGKIRRVLGWQPQETFASGLRKTVAWYMQHYSKLPETAGERGAQIVSGGS